MLYCINILYWLQLRGKEQTYQIGEAALQSSICMYYMYVVCGTCWAIAYEIRIRRLKEADLTTDYIF